MKSLLFVTGLAVGANTVLAAIPVGRGEVNLDLTASATYDSNVFGSPAATGDFYGTLTPHAVYTRKAGAIEAEANVGVSFERYLDQTQLNAANVNADATLRLAADPASRNLSGSVGASYHESSDVNADVNARINSKTTALTGAAALVTGPRTDLAFHATYTDIERNVASNQQLLGSELRYDYRDFFYGNKLLLTGNYDQARSSGQNLRGADLDQTSYSFAAGLGRSFYHDTVQGELSYGYRVLDRARAETTTGATRQSGPVITASLQGPFLPRRYFPKVTSRLVLSYQDASTPGVNDTGGKALTGALELDWQARTNTMATFTATRGQRLSADDLTVVSSALLLGLAQTFRYNLTGSVSAGYSWDTYRGTNRSDQTVLATAGLKYNFARSWVANASYRLSSVTSSDRRAAYDRQVTSLSVTYQF